MRTVRYIMTAEKIFLDLYDKYGEEFNWGMIPFNKTGYFVNELKNELGQENIIFSNRIYAVARSYSDDDVLYLFGGDGRGDVYRIYHLTYSSKNTDSYPQYKEFSDIQEVKKYIEEQFVSEYL